jgi:zinc protease
MPSLPTERRTVAEDAVKLPRLYLAWHTPGYYAPGDAEFDLLSDILAGGKTSRLYRKLVYELRIAQDVRAHQSSRELSGVFQIEATAATGHTLAEIEVVIDAELERLRQKGVTAEEVAMARAGYEADFVRGLQRVGGFGGKADRLNRYYTLVGTPDYLQEDLDRFRQADRKSVAAYLRRYLTPRGRAVLHIVPQGQLVATQGPAPVDRRDVPRPNGEVVFAPPRIQTAELANGLQIFLVEKHELPLVELRLNIKSGWSSDPADRAGTAALTADLLDEGAGGRDALALARQVARLGARLRTTSTFDASTVNLNMLRRHLDAGLALMRSVVREPTFAPKDLERVRQSYLGRQKQEASQPRTQALKEFQRRCFGAEHAYAQPFTGTGTPASVAALDIGDLRRFHAEHYRPNNAVLVVVGDLTLEQAVALADDNFGDWPAAATPAPAPAPIEPYAGPRLVVIDRPGAVQSTIVGGYINPARNDPDFQVMEVVNAAFGGQFSSRINLNLREDKGFTYGARSELRGFKHGGVFLMVAPVETASTAESVQELLGEMTALRSTRPLQGDELAASRDRLTQGFPRRFETYGSVAAGLSELAQFALPLDTWQSYAERVGRLDAADVAAAVQRHLDPDRVIWVIVGDWQVLAAQLTGLGLGEIEVLRTP